MFTQTKPSIVFVHGIWADGSCFGKVIPRGFPMKPANERLTRDHP